MQSALLLLHKRFRIAPSIRGWVTCVFALSKCVDCYQNVALSWRLAAQNCGLIALIEQFSALFEQGCAGFVALFAAPASAAPLWFRWWGRS
jgi:hypothetical protein